MYQKTPMGIAEIAASERTLNFRQRQALILVDGKRSSTEIAIFLNQPNMPETLAELERLGYIHNTTQPANSQSIHSNPQVSASPLSASPIVNQASANEVKAVMTEEQVASVKAILIASTEQLLGIMGRQLKLKIESALTDEQIIACTSQWHMAMRESKSGKEVAGELMEQVQQVLKG